MSKVTPKLFIIILNYNTSDLTLKLLNNLEKLKTNGINAHCVVIDNASNPRNSQVFKNYKLSNMKYSFLQNSENLGFAGGNNTGIKYALNFEADYVLLLNNDVILPDDLLVKLTDFMQKNPEIGMVSPKIYFAKGFEFHKDRYSKSDKGRVIWYAGSKIDRDNVYTRHIGVDEVDEGQYNHVTETDTINGACVIIRRNVFEKVGLFDESLFLYWEDADLSERALRKGFKILYFPGTHIWHEVSVSTGGSGGSLNDYYLTRNRFIYAMRYSSSKTKFAVFRDNLRILINGRTWQKRGAFDAFICRKGKSQWIKK